MCDAGFCAVLSQGANVALRNFVAFPGFVGCGLPNAAFTTHLTLRDSKIGELIAEQCTATAISDELALDLRSNTTFVGDRLQVRGVSAIGGRSMHVKLTNSVIETFSFSAFDSAAPGSTYELAFNTFPLGVNDFLACDNPNNFKWTAVLENNIILAQ